jgi:hypothetical protein
VTKTKAKPTRKARTAGKTKTKNTGEPYEALTEQVFARLLAQGNVCAKIERDVVLLGKSTKHQIDVTFEFVAGPTSYRTLVQCKDWGSAVKQEQVLAFHGVLSDIAGQPRGIMVSRSGFQEGARSVAEHHGIKLYELREPRDEDWNGLIRSVVIDMHLRAPYFDDVRLVPDEEAIRKEVRARGLPGINFEFGGHPGLAPVVFESGQACDLNRILNGLVPASENGPIQVRHVFTEAVFAEIPGSPIPRLAMQAIEATISVREHREQMTVSVDHLIAYCFRDVLAGSVQFLGADGGPVPKAGAPASNQLSQTETEES